MYSSFQIAFKYLRYYLRSMNGKGHGMHSPFVFDFITKVKNDHREYYAYGDVERLRNEMLANKQVINVEDMGAGSSLNDHRQRRVCDIARHAAKPAKYGKLFFRMAAYYKPCNMVDIGTSLGITTSYIAAGNPAAKVITLEGASAVADIASENFQKLQLNNVRLVRGNFDDTLPVAINELSTADLVFFDGNHRKEPTVRYFNACLQKINNESIFIFDDIHWSHEMEEAWEVIKTHPSVKCSIDLFFVGIVFFRDEFKEAQHFNIRF